MLIHRMQDQRFAIAFIRCPKLRAVACPIGIFAIRTQAFAKGIRDIAVPIPIAGTLDFAFGGLLAQVVNVYLSQHAQYGQGQFAPGCREVQPLLYGYKEDISLFEAIKAVKQTSQVAVEAVDLIRDHNIFRMMFVIFF